MIKTLPEKQPNAAALYTFAVILYALGKQAVKSG
jgi:hypothetical protein